MASHNPNEGLEAVSFEKQLEEEGFVPHDGPTARLGELLIAAGALSPEALEQSLEATKRDQQPLGRTLVQNNRVESEIIIRALKLQSLVRAGKISVESAEQKLVSATNQRRASSSREFNTNI
jgi:hypothetical protein